MTTTKTLLLLPGDGIGPEVMAQAKRVLDWVQTSQRRKIRRSSRTWSAAPRSTRMACR